jgi:hypothetical protein
MVTFQAAWPTGPARRALRIRTRRRAGHADAVLQATEKRTGRIPGLGNTIRGSDLWAVRQRRGWQRSSGRSMTKGVSARMLTRARSARRTPQTQQQTSPRTTSSGCYPSTALSTACRSSGSSLHLRHLSHSCRTEPPGPLSSLSRRAGCQADCRHGLPAVTGLPPFKPTSAKAADTTARKTRGARR